MRVQYKTEPPVDLQGPFEAQLERWASRRGLTVRFEREAFYTGA